MKLHFTCFPDRCLVRLRIQYLRLSHYNFNGNSINLSLLHFYSWQGLSRGSEWVGKGDGRNKCLQKYISEDKARYNAT